MINRKKTYQVCMAGENIPDLMKVRIPLGKQDLKLEEIKEKMAVALGVKLFKKDADEATVVSHVVVTEQYVME